MPEPALAELIDLLWRNGNMPPVIKRQQPIQPAIVQRMDDVLDSGIPAAEMNTSKITTVVYGRNGVGKTTFACQGPGPTALISIDPAPTGGARSVKDVPGVIVYMVAARYLTDPFTGKPEKFKGSEKVLAIADSIKRRTAAGVAPFAKVVIDGLTSWNDIILSEILRMEYDDMPAILSKGKVSTEQYVQRSESMIRYLRPLVDLPCDCIFLAQEKDHNPPKNDKGVVIGSKLIREVHPSALDKSFYSLALGDEQTRWVQNACDFVMQLYEEEECREERTPDINMGDGSVIAGVVQHIPTGRRVRRLRCTYHPNYAARYREDYKNVPEYIEAPTPAERYQAFMDVVSGKRTKWGKYADQV